jgi:hypothetical protein
MQLTAGRPKIVVSADGTGMVCMAGGLLLVQTLRLTGLDRGLSAALGRWRAPRAVHDPGICGSGGLPAPRHGPARSISAD